MIESGKFIINEKERVKFFTIDSFEKTKLVKAIFTTRIGGVSKKPFDSLNLSLNGEDNDKDVIDNYKIVSNLLGMSLDRIALSDQVHSNNIKVIRESDCGKGLLKDKEDFGIDGLVTNSKNIPLFTFYADCVPLFFLDKRKKVVALAHAGWKGTISLIGEKMIDVMVKEFDSSLEDILVGIGPSIGPCCYEVGEDVAKKFNDIFTKDKNPLNLKENGKYDLDLWSANMILLNKRGIPEKNITISKLCTSCNNDIFYSYRKEDGKTGRMAAIIEII